MPSSFKRVLEEIARHKTPGPSATFSVFHILRAIEQIGRKPVGRNTLAETLNVGDGAVRTIIQRLKNAGLVTTSKTGCILTKKGLALWKQYNSILKQVAFVRTELTHAKHNSAILIRNHGYKLKSGMEQRDAAIMAGAKNATTMTLVKGHLQIPSISSNMAQDFPQVATQLIDLLQPEENDVIIVAGADSPEKAIYGALAAAWTLLEY